MEGGRTEGGGMRRGNGTKGSEVEREGKEGV